MNIPTAHSSETLERFLQHITDMPIPNQVNRSYLKESGFTSGNDPELRHIFRLLGFLDDEDQPQDRWRLYKEQGREILRQAVLECYKELFELFPNASYAQTDAELAVWFRPPITGDTRSAVERAIRTFRKLSQLAGIAPRTHGAEKPASIGDRGTLFAASKYIGTSQPALQLPTLKNKADYKQLLEAIKEVFYE